MKTGILSPFFNLPKPIKKIDLIVFIYYLGWGIAFPFIPLYLKELFDDYITVGLIFGLLYFFSVPWALFLGEYIDRLPKKSIIFFVLLLYLPFSFVFLALRTFWQFIFLRIFHGGISTSFWATTEAYTRQHSPFSKSSLCISSYYAFTYLPLVVGGILGGIFFYLFGYNIIYSISIFAFLAVFVASFLPNKEKTSPAKVSIEGEIKGFIKNKNLFYITLYICLLMFLIACLDITLPLFTKYLGGSPLKIGIIYSLFYLPFFFQIYFAYPKNKKRLLLLSIFLAIFAFLLMAMVNLLEFLFLAALALGLSISVILPIISGKITNFINKKKIGQQSSVYFAFKSLAMGIGYFITGFIAEFWGIKAVFILGVLIATLIFLIFFNFKESFSLTE